MSVSESVHEINMLHVHLTWSIVCHC